MLLPILPSAMLRGGQVIYAQNALPTRCLASVFLAGPTPLDAGDVDGATLGMILTALAADEA